MARMVKRLSQLEIDEVSLVDRPANQHGLVAIAKNDQEDTMPELYDAEGTPVEAEDLQVGDFVYDEQGTEYVYTETDDDDAGDDGYDPNDADLYDGSEYGEYAEVGKAAPHLGPVRRGARGVRDRAVLAGGRGRDRLSDEKLATQMFVGRQGRRGMRAASEGGDRAYAVGERAGRATRGHLSRNRVAYGAGSLSLAGGYGGSRVGKSYGEQVLETLSKSLNDSERDVAVAKAFGVVEEISKRNDDLEDAVAFLLEDRERGDYVELAKNYELPMEYDDLGGLLHRAAQVLDQDDLEALDRILSGASEVNKAYFEEVGYGGGYVESDILDQVYGIAEGAVAKNAELGLTREQAVTALFSANPEAYDQYELEQNQR